MNIAFAAILIALLLVPGALFRLAYLRGFMRRGFVSMNLLGEDLAYILVASVLITPVGLWILTQLGITYPSDVFVPLLVGNYGKDGEYLKPAIAYFQNIPPDDWAGFLGILVASWVIGTVLHLIVRGTRMDHNIPGFRFTNEWHYILDAQEHKFDGITPEVYIIVATDSKDATLLYQGVVEDWVLDKTGQIERFVLNTAFRRKLADDSTKDKQSEWYPIEADTLMIRYSDCRNIAVHYIYEVEGEVISEVVIDETTT
jgi:hypothetical protein